jgi:hypothetical protein
MKLLRLVLALSLAAFTQPTWAAWAFGSIGSVVTDTTPTSIAVTVPSGISAGDTLFLVMAYDEGTGGTWTTPSGWTLVATNDSSDNNQDGHVSLFCKTAAGGEGTVTVTGATNSIVAQGVMMRWTGGSCTQHVIAQINNTGAAQDIATPARTISNNNTLVLWVAMGSFSTGGGTVNSWPSSATSRAATDTSSSTQMSFFIGSLVQTTATNISAGSIDLASTNSIRSYGYVISLDVAAGAPPTFSVAPALGTRTTSSIPVTATSACTDCTFYGVAYTDGGGTPSCAQIKAGNDQSGSAAYKSFSAAVTATVQVTGTFSTYTNGTVRDAAFCLNSTANGDSSVATLADLYKIPAFTSGPTFSSCTTGSCTYSVTLDGPGTVYGVACKTDSTAATVTQVEAGNCTGNVAATAAANKAVTGADTLTIGSSLDYPIHDFAIVGTYGSQHEAAIHADNARLKSAPSGYVYDTLASVSSTSWCNSIASPAAAATDVVELSSPTTLLAQSVTVSGTCDWIFSNTGARDRVCARVYDRSVKDWMSVSPANTACNNSPTNRAAIWFNNIAPFAPGATIRVFVPLNVAMTPQDLSNLCDDPEDDPIIVTAEDALPTGLSIVANVMQGTATVQGITRGIRIRCADPAGDYTVW